MGCPGSLLQSTRDRQAPPCHLRQQIILQPCNVVLVRLPSCFSPSTACSPSHGGTRLLGQRMAYRGSSSCWQRACMHPHTSPNMRGQQEPCPWHLQAFFCLSQPRNPSFHQPFLCLTGPWGACSQQDPSRSSSSVADDVFYTLWLPPMQDFPFPSSALSNLPQAA